MRFIIGPIPPASDFVQPSNGWAALREPQPLAAIALSLPIGVVLAYSLGIAWTNFTPIAPGIGARFDSVVSSLTPLVALLMLVGIHELLHAVSAPGFGFSSHTIIGFWPSRGMFYAHYDGDMTAKRFLLVLIMPLIVISVLPLLLAVVFEWGHRTIAFLGVLNALCSCVDVFGVVLLLLQVPLHARVRNSGWRTWYRNPETKYIVAQPTDAPKRRSGGV